jgi:hypothetical protein
MAQDQKRVFVIMPFSKTTEEHTEDYWTQHFDCFLKPLIEECGELNAVRSEALRGDILRQIITDLVISPIVVADITDSNPNVYWELGIRHSFKQCTVTVAEFGTRLPFDLSAKGTQFYYPKNHIKNERFKKDFRRVVQDCLTHPEAPDSPVLETISGRGTIYEIIRRDEVIRRLRALISEHSNNKLLLDQLCDQLEKGAIISGRFRTPSAELLMTNRYVEGTEDSYGDVERYYNYATAMNERLVTVHSTDEIERFKEWFYRNKENYYSIFDNYERVLKMIQDKLEARSL